MTNDEANPFTNPDHMMPSMLYIKVLKTIGLTLCWILLASGISYAESTDRYRKQLEAWYGSALFGPDDYIEPTAYDGFYAIRSDQLGRTQRYFDEKFTSLLNIPAETGMMSTTDEGASIDGVRSLRKRLARQIPLNKFINIKNKTGHVAVVYSAPDCSYCKEMEKALQEKGISYYVAPTGLSDAGMKLAVQAYCSVEQEKAWSQGFTGKITVPSLERCVYPRKEAMDFAYLFMVRTSVPPTPLIVFPDGLTYTGWNTAEYMSKILERVKAKKFFPSTQ